MCIRDSTWTQQAYVKGSNTEQDDYFGDPVALFGDTLAVTAGGERSAATGLNGDQADNSAMWAGAVYLYVRSGGTWTQRAWIKASNTDSSDRFGRPLALSDDTLVMGAAYEDSAATGVNGDQADNSARNAGAAYVRIIAP